MKLPPRYTLTIHGTAPNPHVRPDQWAAVMYLFQRLLSGETVAEGELEHFGFVVCVEEDMDQGEE